MLAKIELSLAPSKAKGLSEDERLELGRLLLKAGYRVDIVRRRPNANPGTQYEYYMILDKGIAMPDTRKGHNPSGAPDPTRARAENNIQKDEKRVHDLIHVLRYVADAAGFEIAERIVLIDSQSGRIYR